MAVETVEHIKHVPWQSLDLTSRQRTMVLREAAAISVHKSLPREPGTTATKRAVLHKGSTQFPTSVL
jgi:hypothetical protein